MSAPDLSGLVLGLGGCCGAGDGRLGIYAPGALNPSCFEES